MWETVGLLILECRGESTCCTGRIMLSCGITFKPQTFTIYWIKERLFHMLWGHTRVHFNIFYHSIGINLLLIYHILLSPMEKIKPDAGKCDFSLRQKHWCYFSVVEPSGLWKSNKAELLHLKLLSWSQSCSAANTACVWDGTSINLMSSGAAMLVKQKKS